jgi:hypothetical protein
MPAKKLAFPEETPGKSRRISMFIKSEDWIDAKAVMERYGMSISVLFTRALRMYLDKIRTEGLDQK